MSVGIRLGSARRGCAMWMSYECRVDFLCACVSLKKKCEYLRNEESCQSSTSDFFFRNERTLTLPCRARPMLARNTDMPMHMPVQRRGEEEPLRRPSARNAASESEPSSKEDGGNSHGRAAVAIVGGRSVSATAILEWRPGCVMPGVSAGLRRAKHEATHGLHGQLTNTSAAGHALTAQGSLRTQQLLSSVVATLLS